MPRSLSRSLVAVLLMLSAQMAVAAPADFVDIVEASTPAVVNIETTRFGERPDPDVQRGQMPEDMPELFRRFFEPFGDGMPRGRPDRRGGGSGFIVEEDGLIITNHHVIEEADEIIVRLSDRREFVAELVGSDAETDVAVLRIDADDLPTLEYGDSSTLRPGEWVIAIGSPFQFEQSVTAGIVSAKGRTQGQQQYVPFIQSDVAINRGNSGGPLIDTEGRVVGINSWILSSSGGNIGLSFSIPIETATSTIDQLLEFGRVSRGFLGVGIQSVDRERADALGLDRPVGALVNSVEPDSAADRAGIEVGDVILEVDGRSIEVFSDLPPIVGSIRPGREIELVISRWGETRELSVTLDEREEDQETSDRGELRDAEPSNALGLTVEELSDEQARRAEGIDEGLVITGVDSDNAYRAGIRSGDVIRMINNQEVRDMDDFDEIVQAIEPGRSVALLVWRNGTTQFVAYTPEGEG
ncbi:MAG: Do family serine endopeptidase [Wenzhouxiangellaceae bacterium]|nr:Do family serine endopeptidase [Wenzhouxiangellaceae bacterium]MBS3824234.1 Do family serine endopeptidase [Wenzhouxiangellaceae bacterium]